MLEEGYGKTVPVYDTNLLEYWRYSSTHSYIIHKMAVSSHLHACGCFISEERTPAPTK